MHAKIGMIGDTTETLKFADQEVDFTQFFSGAIVGTSVGVSVIAAIVSLAF